MKSPASRFLSAEERERVTRCVQEVEKHSSGEIVPVIASSSYGYPAATLLGALLIGVVVSGALTAVDMLLKPWGTLSPLDMWVFPAAFAVCFLVFHELIHGVPALKRFFAGHPQMDAQVLEAALAAFYRHHLADTRDRTGILIYVSVFERRAAVLADEGINAKVPTDSWRQVVDLVVKGIRDGRRAEGLCSAIARCGELITAKFPIRAGDKDELRNLIVED
jgi:putative membrane protein